MRQSAFIRIASRSNVRARHPSPIQRRQVGLPLCSGPRGRNRGPAGGRRLASGSGSAASNEMPVTAGALRPLRVSELPPDEHACSATIWMRKPRQSGWPFGGRGQMPDRGGPQAAGSMPADETGVFASRRPLSWEIGSRRPPALSTSFLTSSMAYQGSPSPDTSR
jgi:hypothetical protein